MKKLLIATTNKGKIRELSEFLSDLPLELVSFADVGITDDADETGTTFLENSQLKARFYSKKSGLPAVADDGGLLITALGGAPGVKSRRWLGYEATDEELIEHMKKVSRDLPDDNRQAFFETVVTVALPDGTVDSSTGKLEGIIAKEPSFKLEQGYPYRSFFFIPQLNRFYFEDELTSEEMKLYHHRYKAVEQLKNVIKKKLF